MKRSEKIAWIIVCCQLVIILSNRHSWTPAEELSYPRGIRGNNNKSINGITTATDPKTLMMNDHTFEHYQNQGNTDNVPFYDVATIHPESAGFVERVWHSNGYPNVDPKMKIGSCWCGADKWYVF